MVTHDRGLTQQTHLYATRKRFSTYGNPSHIPLFGGTVRYLLPVCCWSEPTAADRLTSFPSVHDNKVAVKLASSTHSHGVGPGEPSSIISSPKIKKIPVLQCSHVRVISHLFELSSANDISWYRCKTTVILGSFQFVPTSQIGSWWTVPRTSRC
jgi:hypothetical protein